MHGDAVTILVILALILLSAYFSATETAFSALSRSRIRIMTEHGNRRAMLVQQLCENYDKLLSTILVGNNIVNIAASALATVYFIRHLGDASGPTAATVVMTVLVLIFGEITPKSLAKEMPERFAMVSAPFLRFFELILSPVNYVFSLWQKLLNRLIRVKDDRRVTDEELLTIVEEAENEGAIDREESELIRSAIEFNDQEAADILTPRVQVVAVENTISAEELERVFRESGLSRLPVYEESIDNVIGVVNLKDFYENGHDGDFRVTDIMTEPVFVSDNMKIANLLRFMQGEKTHFAVVADEYGGMEGIVTLEDILEELVGEIWDEHDEVIEEFVEIGENRYRILCSADLDKMFEFFDLDCEEDAVTVSGWVMEELGRIPAEGDAFDYENLHVEVTKTDQHRVLEITVTVKR